MTEVKQPVRVAGLIADWVHRDENPSLAGHFHRTLGLHPAVSRILANRNLATEDDCKEFLKPTLAGLHDPFLMKDMEAAADRIAYSIRKKERIVVFGDYDADGITSTALMLRGLRHLGADVQYYIPHRLLEGYGMNLPAIQTIRDQGAQLVITVDTGISACDAANFCTSINLPLIITDHHQPAALHPDCCAVVNPNQAACSYPNKNLTGVGVAWKTLHAVMKTMQRDPAISREFLATHLDLVAIGTLADAAPPLGENRCMISYGLEQAARSIHPGVQALVRAARATDRVTSQHTAFQIAPRLNAAGRTQHAGLAVDLLLAESLSEAREIIARIDRCNQERKDTEARITAHCLKVAEESPDDPILILADPKWHLGVVGIVASRVLDAFHKPVIILGKVDGLLKGSGRSHDSFNLHAALTAVSHCLTAFGGHPNAAGLSLKPERLQEFREALFQYASDQSFLCASRKTLSIDTVVEAQELNSTFAKHLYSLEPFGQQNPFPLLVGRNCTVAGRPSVLKEKHLKMGIVQNGTTLAAIGFGMGHLAPQLQSTNAPIDIAFTPYINNHTGIPRLEMEIKDIRLQESGSCT